jgi:putative ABC transport system permease protein
MSGPARFARRLAAFLRPGRADRELDREIAAHRALFEEDQLRNGLSPEQARRAADRAFLAMESAKDAHRDSRSFPWLEDARRDVRYGLRLLLHDPALTVTTVLTLALGIGVASAIFSLVYAVVLRPLDYGAPAELVQLYETGPREGGEADWVSYPNFLDWRNGAHAFSGMAAYRYQLVTMTGASQPESMVALEVTDRLFDVLQVRAELGRTFAPGEDRPDRSRVAVIGHSLWIRQFAGASSAIGKSVMIDGAAHTIVGVMPAGFAFPLAPIGDAVIPIELWIPVRPSEDLTFRGSHNYWTIARLGPGATLDRARIEMRTIADRLAREYPATNRDFTVTV